MNFYCYICGKELLKTFNLLTMKIPTDRVFLCCNNCVNIAEDTILVRVKKIK